MAATNRLFVDLVSGVIDTTIDNDDTTLSGAALAELPVVADPDFIALTLDPEESVGAAEVVWVTAHSNGATTATILRAQEGTAAREHLSGTKFVAPLTKAAIEGLYTTIENAETNLTNLINGAVSDLNSAEQELETAEGVLTAAAEAVNAVQPVGAILMWPTNTPPEGWLICNGDAVSRTTYSDLFAVVGTTFGEGDGSTTFNLPNYEENYPMGASAGHPIGQTFGSLDHVHSGPSHVHAGPSHSHQQTPHTHSMSNHTHSISSSGGHAHTNNHTHDVDNATTTSAGSHSHSFSDSFTTSGESVSQVVAAGSGQSVADNHTHTGSVSGTTGSGGNHSHQVSFTTGNASTATGSGGSHTHGGATGSNNEQTGDGSASLGNTSTSGTGNTSAAGTGDTGSANPPTLPIHFIIRTGVQA